MAYVYQDGEYLHSEPTCNLVYDIFHLFNNRETLTDIAWKMEGEEWPTAKGGKWTAQTIKDILSNRFYVEAENPIVTEEMFDKAAARLAKMKPGPQQ